MNAMTKFFVVSAVIASVGWSGFVVGMDGERVLHFEAIPEPCCKDSEEASKIISDLQTNLGGFEERLDSHWSHIPGAKNVKDEWHWIRWRAALGRAPVPLLGALTWHSASSAVNGAIAADDSWTVIWGCAALLGWAATWCVVRYDNERDLGIFRVMDDLKKSVSGQRQSFDLLGDYLTQEQQNYGQQECDEPIRVSSSSETHRHRQPSRRSHRRRSSRNRRKSTQPK